MSPGSRRVSGELVRAYGSSHVEAESEVVAHSHHARAVLLEVEQLAPAFRAVLLCGETGTGKTVLAKRLHALSPHAVLPLRLVNCAALSDGLLADVLWELDGEAVRSEQSEPSRTILLDEVGELSPWGQAVLLRKLQCEPLGAKARFIAATHRNLDLMAARGAFSRELLFRLCMARIAVSPLRDRCDDVVPLALHFLRLALRAASTRFISVDPALYLCLERYDWPGNVRELKNAIFNALAVNDSGTLEVADLPDAVRDGANTTSRCQ